MVKMLCLNTHQYFDVDDPPCVLLKNNRYAYRAECPWKGKDDQTLYAYKFCSKQAYDAYCEKSDVSETCLAESNR